MLRRRRPQLVRGGRGRPGHGTRSPTSWAGASTSSRRSCSRAASSASSTATGRGQPRRRRAGRREAWRASPLLRDRLERAILRRRLRVQRQEMRQIASWADARRASSTDRRSRSGRPRGRGRSRRARARDGRRALRDLLTRRELEVLELMVQGETNADIARELVVSEGTVKFHVKNILRKLHAANRAEATSRYLRLSLRRTVPAPGRMLALRWKTLLGVVLRLDPGQPVVLRRRRRPRGPGPRRTSVMKLT